MTNQPPDNPRDLSVDDLQLKPQAPAKRRERVDPTGGDSPELLLTPQPSSHHHHHHHSHSHSHKHSHHSKKKRPVRTAILIVLMSLLGIVVVAVSTFAVLQARGKAALLATENMTLSAPDSVKADPTVTIADDGRNVTYKGNTYIFNENRTNILCIGMDKSDMALDSNVVGTGGHADTIAVLSIDTVTGDVDVLAISRDTMVDVDLYTAEGSFYGVEHTQICLAYAYGDGRETSCENVVRSASRLLYGIPINTYFAVSLDTVPVLNDAIGGVTLTSLIDFRRTDGSWVKQGEVLTLHGEEALRYVRSRDTTRLDSNNERMERQKQYITTFFSQAMAATKEDLQVPLTLYNTISSDSVSTLSPSKITYLATTLVQHDSTLAFSQVPGEVVKSNDDGLAEFVADETAVYEQVLDIFYTKL